MYHRNGDTPPPGYGGTAFDMRPAWPPREEPPRELKRGETPGFAPFAAGKRAVQEDAPTSSEQASTTEKDTQAAPAQETSRKEDTLLLFGILLLLLHGEDSADLLPLLSMLLFLS
jgi:hypothetical protein